VRDAAILVEDKRRLANTAPSGSRRINEGMDIPMKSQMPLDGTVCLQDDRCAVLSGAVDVLRVVRSVTCDVRVADGM
jgi:hypothetical protein